MEGHKLTSKVPVILIFLLILIPVIGVSAPRLISPSSDRYEPLYGITFHKIKGSYDYADRYINQLNVKIIRYDIEWAKTFPERNKTNEIYIEQMRSIVKKYHNLEYKQVIVFWSPPEWAKELSYQEFTAEYIYFLSFYIDLPIDYFQIGNEPNSIHSTVLFSWKSEERQYFFNSALMYVKAHNTYTKTAMNILVYSGWIEYTYTLIGKPDNVKIHNLDILAIDYYPSTWNVGSSGWQEVEKYLDLLDKYNGRFRGAIFETGYSTPVNLDPTAYYHQKVFYEKSIPNLIDILTTYNSKLSSKSYVVALIFYCLENYAGNYYNPELNFGLIEFNRDTGEIHLFKPAYYVVIDIVKNYVPNIIDIGISVPVIGNVMLFSYAVIFYSLVALISYSIDYLIASTIASGDTIAPSRKSKAIRSSAYAGSIIIAILLLTIIPSSQFSWIPLFIIPLSVAYNYKKPHYGILEGIITSIAVYMIITLYYTLGIITL